MDQNHKKLNKSRDQNSRQFGAIFWIFEIYGGNHKQEEIRGNQKLLIPYDEG
jgi:hypothetical protein